MSEGLNWTQVERLKKNQKDHPSKRRAIGVVIRHGGKIAKHYGLAAGRFAVM